MDEQPTNHTTDSISASETIWSKLDLSKAMMAMLKVKRSADTEILDCASLYLDGLGDGISLSESDENIYNIEVILHSCLGIFGC